MRSTPTADHRVDLHASAAALGAVIASIGDDQLSRPTPSTDYTVADLLEHVDGLSWGLQHTARKEHDPGEDVRDGAAARLTPGWRTRVPAELDRLADAWADPAAWVGDTVQGGVPLPAAVSGMLVLDELIVHGWELARATGIPFDPDPVAVDAVLAFLLHLGPIEDEGVFGPAVEVPASASALDRLLGRTGRDPAWRPTDADPA